MRVRVYIAGPMTGYKNFNREAFHNAEEELKREGHTVLNPAVLPDGLTQPQYMDICMAMIRSVDVIYMLKDWQRSAGAKAELALAEKLGHVVIFQRGAICRFSGFRRCGKKKCGKVL
ncbi:TPA: DUF4406 domain-containing protein [Escherichia coli]|uniref:DUF4406 domain-containing protein n=1 Tax=Escherichia coli TaxID=562 RepID=UPI0003A99DDF|nr:DUF4406 domain-containing protein [Escherichia coli]EEW0416974.1 DUF4406 domain-containing protein [Escherichia coli]EEX9685886.1 DUF4406 domain-containing protein [Escherichia coli]EEZ4659112.1 DUF4406 domain-containing protein [Escherichia coli]EFO2257095.1 DUF4406 domain-containing protein [Escherichia coli]EGJ7891905.1 DUF4406 domain-containing protein [Escherichia coli]